MEDTAGEGCAASFSGGAALHDVMAWVVDVSRCLGLVELKSCSSARMVSSGSNSNTLHDVAGLPSSSSSSDTQQPEETSSSSPPPITSDVAPKKISPTHQEALQSNGSLSASSSSTTSRVSFQEDEKENIPVTPTRPIKNLNRFGSVSTPCLLDLVRFKVLCSPNRDENKTPKRASVSDSKETPSPVAAASSSLSENKNYLTQSCEILTPCGKVLPSRPRLSSANSRRIVISKGDCTVQYSPVTAVSVHAPRHAHHPSRLGLRRSPPCIASPLDGGRSTVMDRVCGVGNNLANSGVPPLPATEHPSRPPRLDFCCSQHFESHCISGRGLDKSRPVTDCVSPRRQDSSGRPRRAVRSASGLPDNSLGVSGRSWSEYWLNGEPSNSSEILHQFHQNRTSSLRGPPSRAASAGFLLDNLDLSEVSKLLII